MKGAPIAEDVPHFDREAQLCVEFCERLGEWHELQKLRPGRWLRKMSALLNQWPPAFWLYVDVQLGPASDHFSRSLEEIGKGRGLTRQMIHKERLYAISQIAVVDPNLAAVIESQLREHNSSKGVASDRYASPE